MSVQTPVKRRKHQKKSHQTYEFRRITDPLPDRGWDWRFLVRVYELAREGLSNKEISRRLGKPSHWIDNGLYKSDRYGGYLLDALEFGRAKCEELGETLGEFIFQQLGPDLQALWKEINKAGKLPNAYTRTQELLEGKGERTHQHLFLYCLSTTNFDVNTSMRKCCVSQQTKQKWMQDGEFVRLMDTIHWHKKNFFESRLMDLVAQGDPASVLFVNRTINRDRGYNEKVVVEHQGTVNHQHLIDLEGLDLSLEVRKAILDAIRERDQPKLIETECKVVGYDTRTLPERGNGLAALVGGSGEAHRGSGDDSERDVEE